MATEAASNFHMQLKESFAWEPLLWECLSQYLFWRNDENNYYTTDSSMLCSES